MLLMLGAQLTLGITFLSLVDVMDGMFLSTSVLFLHPIEISKLG